MTFDLPEPTIDARGEWLLNVERHPSPNCDHRPAGVEIDLLVIHAISLPPGCFGGDAIERLFCNRLDPDEHCYFRDISHLRVSAHLLIRRDGRLSQFVPFTRRAWHAGESVFRGREQCNDFSIGIELEGTDDDSFETAQYDCLSMVTKTIQNRWPGIIRPRIVGHSDIAPGRKTDPGPKFDWKRFMMLLDDV